MPTTSNGDCCVELMQGALVRPIARYPSSIAQDDPLKVASNRVRTTLVRSVHSGDTLFTVSDASRIVPQMLLSIDNEIVSVSLISGNILTVIRGFDGTQPCSHSSGSVLNANIVAWHHNVLAAEITAIETALGPNLSNLTGASGVISSNYIWSQTPGGNLTVGTNVVTLTPVPKGVYGVAQYHYVRISGGTGAAEACLITGGTAVPGAASGTIVISCANAHTGAWSIGTASSGIQEAIYSLPLHGGVVQVPPGNFPIYKGFTIAQSGGINGHAVTVQGQGIEATTLDVSQMGTGYVIQMKTGQTNWLRDFLIAGPGSAMTPTDFAVVFDGQNSSGMDRVNINQVPNGVKVTNNAANYRIWVQYADIGYLTGSGGVCISIEGGADHFLTHIATSDFDYNDLASIRIRKSGGTVIKNVDCLQAGLLIDPNVAGEDVGWLFLSEALFDTTQNEALKIAPTNGARVIGMVATNSWFASSRTKDGVRLEATLPSEVSDVSFSAIRCVNNARHGFAMVGTGISDIILASSIISSNNVSNATCYGVYIDEAKKLVINGNSIGALPGFLAQQAAGILFDAGATDNIIVIGNMISDFTAGSILGMNQITGNERIIANNYPTTNTVLTIASATTMDLTGGPMEQYFITGSVPIQVMNPSWYGRKISLLFVNGGSTVTGGNIKSAKTVPVNGSLLCTYDVGGWNLIG